MAENKNHFDLTLDTVKPTGSISFSKSYVNNNSTPLTLSYSGSPAFMKVWFDGWAESTKVAYSELGGPEQLQINYWSYGSEDKDDNIYRCCYDQASWIVVNTSYTTEFVVSGNYYYHVVFMDNVGNESPIYTTNLIHYDTSAPVVSNVKIKDRDTSSELFTNDRAVTISFSMADLGAGSARAIITGDVVPNPTTITGLQGSTYTGTITLTEGDGNKTVSVKIINEAGTESSVIASNTIVLDTEGAQAYVFIEKSGTGHEQLPQWINNDTASNTGATVYADFKLHIKIGQTEGQVHDVVGYKYWSPSLAGTGHTTEPSSYTAITSTAATPNNPIELTGLKFTTTESSSPTDLKFVNVKLIDRAGNETIFISNKVGIDNTSPTITSLTASNSYISASGSSVITFVGNFDQAGPLSYTLKNLTNTKTKDSGSTLASGKTWTINAQDTPTEGANTYELTLVDKAGNKSVKTVTINYDTKAPTATIGTLKTWYNKISDINIPVTISDATSGVKRINAWINTVANDTNSSGAVSCATVFDTPINTSTTMTITSANIATGSIAQSATNYIHLQVIDAVGNNIYVHKVLGYDSVAPTISITSPAADTAYNQRNVTLILNTSDATSGVYQYKVGGQITDDTSWQTYPDSNTINVTLTALADLTKDEYRTISVTIRDTALNESTTVSVRVQLDMNAPTGTFELRKPTEKTIKLPAVVNYPQFKGCLIQPSDGTSIGGLQYRIYGDFNIDPDAAAAGTVTTEGAWVTVPSGTNIYLPGENNDNVYYLTTNNTTQERIIYIQLKDDAGNITTLSQTVQYDTAPPTVDFAEPDFRILSCEHVLRRQMTSGNASTAITGKYCDTIIVNFTPNETITSYKICAYKTQDLARVGTSADAPIPMTNGSTNTYSLTDTLLVGPTENQKTVTVTIRGKDYVKALGTDPDVYLSTADASKTLEGAHYIVVYVKDLGGTWSGKAIFDGDNP